MFTALLNGPTTRCRPAAKSRRLLLEPMEDRCLLSAITIDSPIAAEGSDALTPTTFTVRLVMPVSQTVTVNYRTVDTGSATGGTIGQAIDRLADAPSQAGVDFVHTSGTLTFRPGGPLNQTITIPTVGDSEVELSESFRVSLFGARNARIIRSVGVGTILDDDTPVDPELYMANESMRRGTSGFRYMTFTASLNTQVEDEVRVTAATRNGTAVAGRDYETTRQTIVFAPGQTEATFKVKVYGTNVPTSNRFFIVDLGDSSVPLKLSMALGTLSYGN